MSPSSEQYPVTRTSVPYANDHSLQTLDVFIPQPLNPVDRSSKFWLVFIHGGAWCDPDQTSAELNPALDLLYTSERRSAAESSLEFVNDEFQGSVKRIRERVVGCASVNYGLSPRPGEGSGEKSRSLRHPEHLQDVVKALEWLREEYGVGSEDGGWDYMLVGHSCGATMTFQLAMGLITPELGGGERGFGNGVKKPFALVGLEGLYDLQLLVRNHEDEKFYRGFVSSVFGDDESVWKAVSPVSRILDRVWKDARAVVLGMSREDELVEWEQVEVMREHLDPRGEKEKEMKLSLVSLEGRHDEIWGRGFGVVRTLDASLQLLYRTSSEDG